MLQVGLNKEDRADPEEQKRREMIVWIQDTVSNLDKVAVPEDFFGWIGRFFKQEKRPKDRERKV